MYVGDKGFILAGYNGTNPRVNPDSKKYQLAPRQRGDAAAGERGDNSIDQWVAAVKKRGPAPATNYALPNRSCWVVWLSASSGKSSNGTRPTCA